MTNLHTSDASVKTASESYAADLRAARIGKRLGLLVYFILLIFIISAGAFSIIPQVFGIQRTHVVSSSDEKRCLNEIPRLKSELLRKAGGEIERFPTQEHPEWLREWDRRFRGLGEHCGKLEPTRLDLRTLRDGLASTLIRFHRKQAPLVRRIDNAINNEKDFTSADCPATAAHTKDGNICAPSAPAGTSSREQDERNK